MDFGKSFVFMFEDPNWLRKLVIGTLVVLLGIIFSPILIGFIPLIMLVGYTLDVVTNVMARREHPLPEWEDWGGFLVRGFKVVAAILIWSLPAIVVSIPLAIGSALLNDNSSGAQAVGSLLVICGSCLSILWALFVTLISPAIYVRLAAVGRFGAAFEFGEIWSFTRDNLGNVIIAILLTWVASLIASIGSVLGLALCLIGIVITIPLAILWQTLVMVHLYGQVGANSKTPVEGALVPVTPAAVLPPEAPQPPMPEEAPRPPTPGETQ